MKKYNPLKRRNQVVAKLIKDDVSGKTHTRIQECSNWVDFAADRPEKKFRILVSNFCKNRFCPICASKKARREAFSISVMMDYLADKHKQKFIMVTLTAPNVRADELIDEISKFNLAFKNLCKRENVKKMNNGYVRKLEITYNGEPRITKEMWHGEGRYAGRSMKKYFEKKGLKIGDKNPNYDTYHTHFHVVFSVNRWYFTGHRYIKRDEWLELWQEAMDDRSITQVDVRKIHKTEGRGEAHEIATYAAKEEDYTRNREVFSVFYKALKGRQVLTFSGNFKEARALFKEYLEAKKQEEYHLFDKYVETEKNDYYWNISSTWVSEYIETFRRPLTQEEKNYLSRTENQELEEDDDQEEHQEKYKQKNA